MQYFDDRILFSKNDFGTNENCFAFPLLPGNLLDNQSFENDVLKEGNPNRLLYHVCIKTTDYLELVKKKKEQLIES